MESQSISIIIPTLNEAGYIDKTCEHLKELFSNTELIIVDGGSSDDTLTRGSRYGRVIRSPRGRAIQMNTGAREATGEILWFLHADCLPHPESINKIRETVSPDRVIAGAFEYRLDGDGSIYRISEYLSNLKNRFLNLIYGDMGIFVDAQIFRQVGGFREIPIMEDMDFCKRVKRVGNIAILPYCIMTSARRWKKEGPVINIIRNWFLQLGWALGVSPLYLIRWYPTDGK
jgi:rSAM/selenodomain-associated transferase 2